jgi:Family of unknown function (DUF6932)
LGALEIVVASVPEPTLPEFTAGGVLPEGEYTLTLDQLERSLLVSGSMSGHPHWDAPWRRTLVTNLRVLASQLWLVGVGPVFIDGSFVEDKDHPNDIDGYFECDEEHFMSRRLERELNELDPMKACNDSERKRV